MKKITKTLVSLVKDEAKKVKQLATTEELNNLNFNTLVADERDKCIYGQMTGSCWSNRANHLILTCCERVYATDITSTWDCMENVKLNGKPKEVTGRERQNEYFSPIEIFIDTERRIHGTSKTDNAKALVAYLRGESEALILT